MNKDINQEVKIILVNLYKELNLPFKIIKQSSFKANDYSFCSEVKIKLGEEIKEYFLKIPKRDIAYIKSNERDIFPITERDRELGKNEVESLKKLNKRILSSEIKINLIKFIYYSSSENLIITEKIYGRDFFKILRKASLIKSFLNFPIKSVENNMFNLGKSLAAFSKKKENVENIAEYKLNKSKINLYLKKISTKINFLNYDNLFAKSEGNSSISSDGFKGLDIRNILIDELNEIYLLDPGKTKSEYAESNLARFITTLFIIFWGSFYFFIGFKTHKYYLDFLLKGFFSQNVKINPIILDAEIKKEIIKHWELAIRALENKKWNKYVSRLIKSFYINKFYSSLILNHQISFKSYIEARK